MIRMFHSAQTVAVSSVFEIDVTIAAFVGLLCARSAWNLSVFLWQVSAVGSVNSSFPYLTQGANGILAFWNKKTSLIFRLHGKLILQCVSQFPADTCLQNRVRRMISTVFVSVPSSDWEVLHNAEKVTRIY